jgi:16S rRNA (adenine1518-N6/adenine1519-N6)-dimethyltransferase
MGLRQELKVRLAAAGLAPIHRLGQNFMVDEGALAKLIDGADLASGDRVVEVGPGTGLLTERMLAQGARVLAVELDQGLVGLLRQTQAAALADGSFQLEHGDALAAKTRLHPAIEALAAEGDWALVANLPYDVSLPVILNALALPRPPRRVVVTVQYEAAQRLCSQPGSSAWGASAAVAQAAGRGHISAKLPPQCFHPRPRVDSAVLVWEPERSLPAGFPEFCRSCFAYRRKVLPRALRDHGVQRERAHAVIDACGLDPTLRLEALPVADLLALHAALTAEESP